ncbi:MAG: hypothetical protein M3131_04385 [Actinomycetota bacterium]|nr:hypothetical protein [Actinomycetota bacterium]
MAEDPRVALKLAILERATPGDSAAVFGDMYVVEGAYTLRCLELGFGRVVLVDSLETPGWQRLRLEHPALDFYKGDFSNALFMRSIHETFDVTVCFDVLLHQPPLVHTIHLILEKTRRRMCVVQPMLKERDTPNTLIYLPGNTDAGLYPLTERSPEYNAFDPLAVNQSSWIWGITPSFLHNVLTGEGFTVTAEQVGPDLPNPQWFWYGCIAERGEQNPQHWGEQRPPPGLYEPDWHPAS